MKNNDKTNKQQITASEQLRQRITELERLNSELKGSEEALRKSDERLKTVTENVNEVIFQFSPLGIIEYVSPRVKELYGYKPEELVGKNLKKTTPMRELPKALEVLKYALSGKIVKNFEIDQVKRNGKIVHMEINGMPVKKNGTVIAVLGVMRDITERKRAEEKLQKAYQELEKRVKERTAELSKTNVLLKQEITERKQAEKKLRESEERYRALYEYNPSMYFAVDAEGMVLSVNQFGAEQLGYTVKELAGQPVLNVFYDDDKEAVKRQLTVCIQHPSEVFQWECRKVRKDGNILWVKETARTVRYAEGNLVVFIVCEAITERKQADEHLKESFERLRKSLESTVSALASALEMRDPYTAGHQQRVTDLACAIAEEMGFAEEQIDGIRMAGLIHDIGKINVPAEILNKPGQLTEIEYGLFKNHPQIGHDVLKTVEFPWPVAQIVLQHHERMDGSGYPQGLSGEEIMLEARILAVADIVEAIASHRPYRPARGAGDALEEILHNKGTLYDSEVVDACLRVFYEKGFQFEKFIQVAALPKIH
jgi:PAS domain S-box-containing protein/putative nucleotidyltransferase with HDIG domain